MDLRRNFLALPTLIAAVLTLGGTACGAAAENTTDVSDKQPVPGATASDQQDATNADASTADASSTDTSLADDHASACKEGRAEASGTCGGRECAAGSACIGRDPGGSCVGQFGAGAGEIPCAELNCGWLTCFSPCTCADATKSACVCP